MNQELNNGPEDSAREPATKADLTELKERVLSLDEQLKGLCRDAPPEPARFLNRVNGFLVASLLLSLITIGVLIANPSLLTQLRNVKLPDVRKTTPTVIERGGTQSSPPHSIADSPAGPPFTSRVYRHDGKRFKSASIKNKAEYYILYYAASW